MSEDPSNPKITKLTQKGLSMFPLQQKLEENLSYLQCLVLGNFLTWIRLPKFSKLTQKHLWIFLNSSYLKIYLVKLNVFTLYILD